MWLQGDRYLLGQGLGMLLLSHLERATLLPAKLFVSLHGALTLSYRQGTSSCLMLLSTNQKNKSIFAFFSERLDMQCQPGAACRLQSVLRSLLSPWSSEGLRIFPSGLLWCNTPVEWLWERSWARLALLRATVPAVLLQGCLERGEQRHGSI